MSVMRRRVRVVAGAAIVASVLVGSTAIAGALPTTWTQVPFPSASISSGRASCPSVTMCVVATSGGLLRWDGIAFSTVSLPARLANVVWYDVSCPTTTYCMAVGSPNNNQVSAAAAELVGTHWRTVVGSALRRRFDTVSCPAAHDCMIMGSVALPSPVPGYALSAWQAWHFMNGRLRPSRPGRLHNDTIGFARVSCPTTTFCAAVGFVTFTGPISQYGPVAAIWNGTSWTFVTPPTNGAEETLSDVACASAAFCVAVGTQLLSDSSVPQVPVAYVWDGTAWSGSSPIAPPANVTGLDAVTCPAIDACVVGGLTGDGSTYAHPLLEDFDGTNWTSVPLVDPPGVTNPSIEGLSCASQSDCIAIGGEQGFAYHATGV